MDIHQRKERLEHAGKKLFTRPTKPEAGQSDPELSGREIGIEMRADVPNKNRAGILLFDERIELAAAHFDDGILGRHEKTVERDERDDHRQLTEKDSRRLPLLGDGFR